MAHGRHPSRSGKGPRRSSSNGAVMKMASTVLSGYGIRSSMAWALLPFVIPRIS